MAGSLDPQSDDPKDVNPIILWTHCFGKGNGICNGPPLESSFGKIKFLKIIDELTCHLGKYP